MDAYAGRLEILDRAGITPNGNPETATSNQFADAIEAIIDDHIDANLVDNTHMADMPPMTIKGNDIGLATDPQDLTVSEVKTMLALQNVTNESKATMFTSPTFTGTPTAPSAPATTDTTQVATTEFVHDAITNDTEYLADFRVWDATRTYTTNDPVFYNGVPYRSKTASNLNKTPATNPTDWEVVGGGSAGIGNIFPDPSGSKGSDLWTTSNVTVATVTGTNTGFTTELTLTATVAGNAYKTVAVPTQLRGEELQIKFEAVMVSGTAPTVDIIAADGTTSIPLSQTGINSSGRTAYLASTYSFSADASFRLRFNFSAAGVIAITNIYVGRPEVVQGAVISDWQPYPAGTYSATGTQSVTITSGKVPISGVTANPNKGTVVADIARFRRVGGDLEMEMEYIQSGGGAGGSGDYCFFLPLGYTVDTSRLVLDGTFGNQIGIGSFVGSNASAQLIGAVLADNNSRLRVYYQRDSTGTTPVGSALFSMVGAVTYKLAIKVPCAQFTDAMTIVGLDEPMFLSNTESTVNTNGAVAKTYSGIDGSPIVANTNATYYDLALPRALMPNETPVLEVMSKIDGNWINVQQAEIPSLYGTLARCLSTYDASTYYSHGMGLSKGVTGQLRVYFMPLIGGAVSYANSSARQLSTWASVVAAVDGFTRWRVRIAKSGEVSAVPPTVFASYDDLVGASAGNIVKYTTKREDTHSAYSTTTGLFTCPVAGLYSFDCGLYNGGASNPLTAEFKKNGVTMRAMYISGVSGTIRIPFTITLRLAVGDTVGVYAGSVAIASNSGSMTSITRVGS
jgi:hypothetical protein